MPKPTEKTHGRKSIFRSLFVPLILIMILQSALFYVAAVYGGIEDILSQNAADILSERLYNRKSEVETRFTNRWTNLDDCVAALNEQYAQYEKIYGAAPLTDHKKLQIEFLRDSADGLIATLRYTEANGVFLILNDAREKEAVFPAAGDEKYGLCIRDMDQDSNYSGTEDLLIERAPTAVIDSLRCSLDSWWEAKYSFSSEAEGDYFYAPLNAAWAGLSKKSADLAYCSGMHRISGSDPKVVSYSMPLISKDGYPYAVLGVELSANYLSGLLPNGDLGEPDKSCYVLAMQDESADAYEPLVGTGALFSRCFGSEPAIPRGEDAPAGGYTLMGREGTKLYAEVDEINIYNNFSPFESRKLVLLAMVEHDALFAYIARIKMALMLVSLLSLLLGAVGLVIVSRRFASPITALASRVRGMDGHGAAGHLGRLGITEIDQLVDSIETLHSDISRNSARTEFFSRMSHDMRTPMNAIISFSSPELLAGVDERVKDDYLNKIHASGTYLLGLINEVLDMTKIESNTAELNLSAVQAATLFDTSIPIIEALAEKKNVRFTADIDIPKNCPVTADVQHISQIVMNLLSNAVKFTPEGGSVRLTAAMRGGTCDISVSDTGVGMSPEFMKELYKPFAQENGGHEGTGLGLAIAKKLVELMGGTIGCESAEGVGTTFRIALPLSPASEGDVLPPVQEALPGADFGKLSGKRVLVCEDNAINTTIIERLLTRVGLTVDAVENGARGVERFNSSPVGTYSAILMDIRMPVMDGFAATRAIRALERSDAKSVPIFAMTADAFLKDAENSLTAGMNAHLTKPVEPDKLYGTLLQYIGGN